MVLGLGKKGAEPTPQQAPNSIQSFGSTNDVVGMTVGPIPPFAACSLPRARRCRRVHFAARVCVKDLGMLAAALAESCQLPASG